MPNLGLVINLGNVARTEANFYLPNYTRCHPPQAHNGVTVQLYDGKNDGNHLNYP